MKPKIPTPLTARELAEIDQVIKNANVVAGVLTFEAKLTSAGAIDALIRTVRYLQARLPAPAAAIAPPAAAPAPPDEPAAVPAPAGPP